MHIPASFCVRSRISPIAPARQRTMTLLSKLQRQQQPLVRILLIWEYLVSEAQKIRPS